MKTPANKGTQLVRATAPPEWGELPAGQRGANMPGRSYSSNSYRFGFNGKENDNEIKGTGNSQDYGMRIYDPRIVRFNSVDPLTKQFPFYSPYQFAGNSFIMAIDLDGAEPKTMITEQGKLTQPIISLLNGAFDFDVESLKNTTWRSVNWVNPMNSYAMTTGNVVRYQKSIKSMTGYSFWLNLISHEQKHRNDFGNNWLNQSLQSIGYGVGYALALSYTNNPYEQSAYNIGDPGLKGNSLTEELFLSKGAEMTSILNSHKSDNYK